MKQSLSKEEQREVCQGKGEMGREKLSDVWGCNAQRKGSIFPMSRFPDSSLQHSCLDTFKSYVYVLFQDFLSTVP